MDVLCIKDYVEDDTVYWSDGMYYDVLSVNRYGYKMRHNYGIGMIYNEDFYDYFNSDKNIIDDIITICEEQGWNVTSDGCTMMIEHYSPAGEDLVFEFDFTTAIDIIEGIYNIWESFDTEEHVKMWINSSSAGVPSIKTLVEDADAIDTMLATLKDATEEITYSE